jgi:hypothetical protein
MKIDDALPSAERSASAIPLRETETISAAA